jgi:phospholipid/cholesterol/gamma-HCH transport system substrate-binding protein
MSAYQRNTIVGAVVLIALGMLAWMILQFANKAASFFLTTGMPITLTTSRADGVAEGSPVTYRGVNVGRVTQVRRVAGQGGAAEDILIEALIEANPPLPADLQGRIRQTSLLGASATISLEPAADLPGADSTTRTAAAGQYLSEGANLWAEYVPDITSLGDNIRGLSTSIENLVGDPRFRENVHVSMANIRQTTESAVRLGGRLEELTERFDEIAENTNGAVGDARDTLKDVRGTVGEMNGTVKDARDELRKMSANLNQRMEQVATSLQHVQSVARKIDEGEGTAGHLVNDPKLYESLADTAAEMNLMIKDMRRLIEQWEQEGIIKL